MTTLYYESSISHHGVKGQRWGVRRYQNYDGTLTSAGKKRNRVILSGAGRKLTTNKFKEAMKEFGGTTGSMAISYIPGASLVRLAMDAGKYVDSKTADYIKRDGAIEKVSQMKRMSPESVSDSLTKINKMSMGFRTGSDINCASCSMAMDMRQKGYDVKSRRQHSGLTNYQIADHYKNAKVETIPNSRRASPQQTFDRVFDSLASINDGNSSGILTMAWNGLATGGHAIYYKSENHRVEFYDGQSGKMGSKLDSYFVHAQPDSFSYIRTDNLKPNDSIGECVVSREDDRK